jgi:hypothetical protein
MAILSFLRRRTLSKWADDKAVKDFTRVAENAGLTNDQRFSEVESILDKGEQSGSITNDDMERLNKLLND